MLALLAVALATAALIVSIIRSEAGSSTDYTSAQRTAAKTQLCDRYKVAARAVSIETAPNGDIAFARISMINAALVLDSAATDPALDSKYRDAARALAVTYQTTAAIGTKGMATTEGFREAVDDSNAKELVLKDLCGD